jgi:hypothetical protein
MKESGEKDRTHSDLNNITNILAFKREKTDHNYIGGKGNIARVIDLLKTLQKRIKNLMNH